MNRAQPADQVVTKPEGVSTEAVTKSPSEKPAPKAKPEEKAPTKKPEPKPLSSATAADLKAELARQLEARKQKEGGPKPREPWQMTRGEYVENKSGGGVADDRDYQRHKNLVAMAVQSGKPVPEEVLKEYPDIAKQQSIEDKIKAGVDKINALFAEEPTGKFELDTSKYKQVSAILDDMWSSAVDAGKSVQDFVSMVLDSLSTKAAPYFERWIEEKFAEKESKDDTAKRGDQEAVDTPVDTRPEPESIPGPGPEQRTPEADSGQGRRDDAGVRRAGGHSPERTGGQEILGNRRGSEGVQHETSAAVERDRGGSPSVRSRDFRPAPGGLTREGSWYDTAKRNVDAILLALKISGENRQATPQEQEVLSKYTGFGAGEIRNRLFPVQYGSEAGKIWPNTAIKDDKWKDLAKTLSELPEDWQKSILRSTQYAHYTSESVTRSIWAALERLGFIGGKVFEPGMGIGNFHMTMPEALHKKSSFTGVEYDGPTALIAKLLSPQQGILHADFVKRRFPQNFFDLVIGNPPFSKTKILDDPDYAKHGFSLHDYFFAKSIDMLRPGGLMVFVTSRYTMDKQRDKARRYLAERADLVGAIRLPQTAFRENAGTEVVTDVLFFRKRMKGEAHGGAKWEGLAKLNSKDGEIAVNEYFVQNPDMILGQMRLTGNMDDEGRRIGGGRGFNDPTVVSYYKSTQEFEKAFQAAVEKLPRNIYSAMSRSAEEIKRDVAEIEFDPKVKREGVIYLDGKGNLRKVENGVGKPIANVSKVTAKQQEWLKDYVQLKDKINDARLAQFNDGDWQLALKDLNAAYDAFREKHGPIWDFRTQTRTKVDGNGEKVEYTIKIFKNKKLWKEDYDSSIVLQLEKITEDGEIVKSPFLKGRTIGRPVTPEVKTLHDALAVSLDANGVLDLGDIAGRMGMTKEEAIESLGDLIYDAPGAGWQMADEYLSGNVVRKLEQAEAAVEAGNEQYARNVEALKKVIPKPLGPTDIRASLGAGWISDQYISEFAEQIGAGHVTYDRRTETWRVEGGNLRTERNAGEEYGTSERSPSEILESVLNRRKIVIKWKDEDGKTHTDAEATAQVNEIAKRIREKFKTWIWSDADRTRALLSTYNRQYNNIAPRRFDGSHLTLPGVSMRYQLYPHQKRAIWRIIQTGNTYLAHAVGAGKTIEMIAAGMEMRRLGMVKKPMYVVPNHMLEQFSNEFMELYPLANVMVADDENFSADRRRQFVAQAAMNNPDAVIITHSAFGRISVKPESVAPIRKRIVDELTAALEDTEEGDRIRRSQLEKQIEQVERRFDSITNQSQKDTTVSFEDIGADFLFVDEAHEFRKLDFHTNMNVKGVDPQGSRKALDTYVKTRYLESMNPGRSMVFASGTPVTNTMGELYTLQRFFSENEMDADGMSTFDGWAAMFGETAVDFESNAAGKYEPVERFSTFVNVPELMKRVRMFMDVLTSDQLGGIVERPDLEGGKPEMVLVDATPELKRYMTEVLQPRVETSRQWKPSPGQRGNPDPIIAIISDGRFSSLDPRFFDPSLPPDVPSKLNKMADGIIEEYKRVSDMEFYDSDGNPEAIKGGTQIVFYNLGFGAQSQRNRGFNARQALQDRLLNGGIPASEIAWFDDANTDAKKEAIFKDMRSGKIKVLIGSAKKMGTGVNVQKRLAVLHYFDPPWYPADVEQPHGRIIRQKNQNKIVRIKWYATRGTYDSTMWQMVARKQRFIDQAFSGDDSMRTMEDISESSQYEMAAALASGDQRMVQLAGLTQDIERLQRLAGAHENEQREIDSKLRTIERHYLPNTQRKLAELEAAQKVVGGHVSFESGTIGNRTFTERKALAEAIKAKFGEAANGFKGKKSGWHDLGEFAKVNGRFAVGMYADIPTAKTTPNFGLYVMAGDIMVDIYNQNSDKYLLGDSDIDPIGIVARIINGLNSLPRDIDRKRERVEELSANVRRLKKKLGVPFAYEQELLEKVAERARLQAELAGEGETEAGQVPADRGPTGHHFTTIAKAFREIEDTGAVQLVGLRVESMEDLAVLSQAVRNPKYETFRYIMVKDGVIVGHDVVTSRLPGRTVAYVQDDISEAAKHYNDRMDALGADTLYVVHNHPTGDPKPSQTDKDTTRKLSDLIPRLKGHVVINSGKYAVIEPYGSSRILDLPGLPENWQDPILTPEIGAEMVGGTSFLLSSDVAIYAKTLMKDRNISLVVYLDSNNRVRGIQEVSDKAILNPAIMREKIPENLRHFGVQASFLILHKGMAQTARDLAAEYVKDGVFWDVSQVMDSGESFSALEESGIRKPRTDMFGGKDFDKLAMARKEALEARENQGGTEEAVREKGGGDRPSYALEKAAAVKPTDTVPNRQIIELHEVRDSKKLDRLAEAMKTEGWDGPPVLTFFDGETDYALTGSHRIAAARRAGIDIPVYRIDDELASDWFTENDLSREALLEGDDDQRLEALREIGDADAEALMLHEINSWDESFSLARDNPPRKKGEDQARLEAHIQGITKGHRNLPAVTVVQSQKDLPENINQEGRSIAGAYHNGHVWLVADNLPTVERAEQIFLHETVGHHGVEAVLGKRFRPCLEEVVGLYGKGGLKDIAEAYGFDLGTRDGRLNAAREKIAQIAETGERPGFLKRLYQAIREALRKMGFRVSFSDADIQSLLARAQEYVRHGTHVQWQEPRSILERGKGSGRKYVVFRRRGSVPAYSGPYKTRLAAEQAMDQGVLLSPEELKAFRAADPSYAYAGPKATGFIKADAQGRTFEGPYDHKVRFEIDDSKAELRFAELLNNRKYKLGDVLKHDELFENYPAAKDIEFVKVKTDQYRGSFNGKVIKVSDSLNDREARKTVLHEIQHYIQEVEGWARGGGLASLSITQRSVEHYHGQIVRGISAIKSALARPTVLSDGRKVYYAADFVPSDPFESLIGSEPMRKWEGKDALEKRLKELEELEEEAYELIKKFRVGRKPTLNESHSFYRHLAGEIEARDTAARADLTAEKRRDTPPYSSENILPSKAIVRFSDGVSYSLATGEAQKGIASVKEELSTVSKTILESYRGRSEANVFQRIFRSPEWWKHPTLKRIFEIAGVERPERVHNIIHGVLKLNDVLTPLAAMQKDSPKDYDAVRDALLHMDETGVKWDEYSQTLQASSSVKAAVSSVRGMLDEALELQRGQVKDVIDKLESSGVDPKGFVITQDEGGKDVTIWDYYRQMGDLSGSYFPRKREPGDWAVLSTGKDGTKYREHFRTRYHANRAIMKFKAQGRVDVRPPLPVEREPESVYQSLNMLDMQKFIEQAISRIGFSAKAELALKKEIFSEVADLFKERGFRSSRMKRGEGPVVKGFIEDPIKAVGSYASSLAGGIAKSEAAAKMIKEVAGGIDERKDPERYDLAKEYIAEQLKNPDRIDRMIGLAKSVVSFKYLGFGPKTAFVNVTSILTTAPPAIHQYAMDGKGSLLKVGDQLHRAGRDFVSVMRGKPLANADEQAFMESIQNSADLEQYTREAIGHIAGAYGRGWHQAMSAAMWLFQKTEQWVRGTTMLAAYRLSRANGKTHEEAMGLARAASSRANGIYSKASDPMWAMGANPAARIGKMGYTYMKFAHNYVQMLVDLGFDKKNYKALAFALGAPAVLSGAGASVLSPVILGVVQAILSAGGDDRDPERLIADTIRAGLGESAEQAWRHGVFGLAGVDISGSLSVGVGVPRGLMDLTGPFGGVVENLMQAGRFAKGGQLQRATEEVLPTAFANVSRAIRELDGATTRQGRMVWDEKGRPYIPGALETGLRATGFRPSRRATVEERRWEIKKEEANFASRRQSIYEKYRLYVASKKREPEKLQDILDAISEYNENVKATGRAGIIPYIKKGSLAQQARSMAAPTRRELRAIERSK